MLNKAVGLIFPMLDKFTENNLLQKENRGV